MSIGARLTEARTAAGMTVHDVATATKIRASILTAMEADDFSMCGGDVYARGQLRSVAQVIGLDPDAMVAGFDAQMGAAE